MPCIWNCRAFFWLSICCASTEYNLATCGDLECGALRMLRMELMQSSTYSSKLSLN